MTPPSSKAIYATTLLVLLSGLTIQPLSIAGSFSVSPVRIFMKPQERAVALTVINEGASEVALQADVHEWTQTEDGKDQLALTDDLILAPPIFRLPPQGRQVVRLARLKPMDASRELTFRMILREIPEGTKASDNTLQVPLTLALSLPVFITPPAAKRIVACSAERVGQRALSATCANTGNAYAQVREIHIQHRGRSLARLEGGTYILPRARKALRVQAEADFPAEAMQMDVHYDDGTAQTFDFTLP